MRHVPAHDAFRDALLRRYQDVRATTERLALPLSPEDQVLQSQPESSPTKWHLAHTSWFFETFLLVARDARPYQRDFGYLFNSYYETLGPRLARAQRGMLSRPTCDEVMAYRASVDARMRELIETAGAKDLTALSPTIELGIAHEEQHQELLLTDIQHAFFQNPIAPAYRSPTAPAHRATHDEEPVYLQYEGGLVEIGAANDTTFHFDNEGPRHRVYLEPFTIATRLVTIGEWKAFARDGAYENPSLWLSEGYEWVEAQRVRSPLYSQWEGERLRVFGLTGWRVPSDDEPVTNLSYYEADAMARFMGARLPTEAEWETVASQVPVRGNFLETDVLHALPAHAEQASGVRQLFGDAWEWTQSSYTPYPGFSASHGAIGEYNGKFMINQMVLRGGSCFTSAAHMRTSYRNFWHPHTRFQNTGVRLARSSADG